jgi:hypothetical protein
VFEAKSDSAGIFNGKKTLTFAVQKGDDGNVPDATVQLAASRVGGEKGRQRSHASNVTGYPHFLNLYLLAQTYPLHQLEQCCPAAHLASGHGNT